MVSIKNLHFSYQPRRPLFKDLNLELNKGHIYGLLGKNGAGKSTLLKNIVGLAYPKKGQCLVNDMDISRRPVPALADLYFIPEEIFMPPVTPAVFAENTGFFYPKFSRKQFEEYLDLLEIDAAGIINKQSYGQQKKIMIAFGIATNTSLLVMDEPTNGLDIPSKSQFRKLMASVLTEDRCIVISTHQVRDLDNLIDTLVVLHGGEIVVNMGMDDIAERLCFGIFSDTNGMDVLYEEDNMYGKNIIAKNTAGIYNKVELEFLFNALTTGHPQVLNALKTNNHASHI